MFYPFHCVAFAAFLTLGGACKVGGAWRVAFRPTDRPRGAGAPTAHPSTTLQGLLIYLPLFSLRIKLNYNVKFFRVFFSVL